jgi:hemolysin activation/secretion protein
VLRPFKLRIEPALRMGLPLDHEPSFNSFRLGTQYHQLIAGPIELESRVELRHATASTPVFEQPSLGGLESVRGFRSDEVIGRKLWSSQNELWVPLLTAGGRSGVRDFVRRNVRLAAFYDVGALDSQPAAGASENGLRTGAGLGLRIRYQGVVIEADWAYGFGSDETGRPGRGRFYFNFRLP